MQLILILYLSFQKKMTAFDKSWLPADVNTLEKLAFYALYALSDIYSDTKLTEEDLIVNNETGQVERKSRQERICQIFNQYIETSTPPRYITVFRGVFMVSGLNRGYKPWNNVQEYGTIPLPTEYKA